MLLQIAFTGPAGSGINTTGMLLAKILLQQGIFTRGDKEYASVIKGGTNTMIITLSDIPLRVMSKKIQILFALDNNSLKKNQEIYDIECPYLYELPQVKRKNMRLLGAALHILQLPLQLGKTIIEETFSSDPDNLSALEKGYSSPQTVQYSYQKFQASSSLSSWSLATGNELVIQGAKKAGLQYYAAYPMTPATSLIDAVIKDSHITFFQGEDEIAVAMAMLGATYAGKRAMCGTSGGGFALMVESVSFAMQAEIGGVYIITQRDGPSTGTPTFTGQGDLGLALHSAFGETSPIVLAPSTYEEYLQFATYALKYSEEYQHPVVLLLDKQISEGFAGGNRASIVLPEITPQWTLPENTDTYQRYALTESGISPKAKPGDDNTLFIATSYEHDEWGATNEHPHIKQQQVQKRRKKMQTFLMKEFHTSSLSFEVIHPEASKFLITRGSNRETLESLLPSHPERGLVVLKIFFPVDPKLITFFQEKKSHILQLLFVEMNSEGWAQKWLSEQIGLSDPTRNGRITYYRKTALYPIWKEDIEPLLS